MYYQPTKKILHQVQKFEKIVCQNTIKIAKYYDLFQKKKVKTFLHSKVNLKFSFVGSLAELLISVII